MASQRKIMPLFRSKFDKLNQAQRFAIVALLVVFFVAVGVAYSGHKPGFDRFVLKALVCTVAIFFSMNRFMSRR